MITLANFKHRLRSIGWKELPSTALEPYYLYYHRHFDRQRIAEEWPDRDFDHEVRHDLLSYPDYWHAEWAVRLEEPAVVEPAHGSVVLRGNRVARQLMAIHEGVVVSPMYFPLYAGRLSRAIDVEEAIVLRHHYGEDNYAHFYYDVVPKFLAIERFPEWRSLPLIVGKKQFETRYFQNLVRRAGWSDRRWILQDGTPIRVRRLHCVKGTSCHRAWAEGIWRLFRPPPPDSASQRRIYLKRSEPRRRLANQTEVEALLNRLGFESVDAARLSHDEQMRLFSETRHLVAEHGAGIANILFRQGAPLSLLELFPGDYVSAGLYACCRVLGYQYARLRGPLQEGAYTIPPDTLKLQVEALLAS